MLNSISIGKYYNIKSPIHNMNPTAKIICIIVFLISTLLTNDFILLGSLSVLMFFMMLISLVPIKLYLKQVLSLKYLIVFLVLIYYFCHLDMMVLLIMLIKLAMVMIYAGILTLTTKPMDITLGLEEFFSPLKVFKIPVSDIALMISLALRFIPTILEQTHRILKALSARGIDYYNSSLKSKIKALNILLIPMFVLSFKRADQLSEAMDVRLYNYDKKRTKYNSKPLKLLDVFLIICHISIFAYMTLKEMIII